MPQGVAHWHSVVLQGFPQALDKSVHRETLVSDRTGASQRGGGSDVETNWLSICVYRIVKKSPRHKTPSLPPFLPSLPSLPFCLSFFFP